MRKVSQVFGVISALLPVIYCGWLVFYFSDTAGSLKTASDIGLAPTLLGLTVVGLLLCIPLFFKLSKLVSGPRTPGSGGTPGKDGGFDADAALARYMANRPPESDPATSRATTRPTTRATFGRPKA